MDRFVCNSEAGVRTIVLPRTETKYLLRESRKEISLANSKKDQKDLLNLPLYYRAMYFYIVMCSL